VRQLFAEFLTNIFAWGMATYVGAIQDFHQVSNAASTSTAATEEGFGSE
jgi:hypothetical protein